MPPASSACPSAPASRAPTTQCVCSISAARPQQPIPPSPHQLHEPFCQPFGNRRLVHCVPAPASGTLDTSKPHTHAPGEVPQGETPAWESCGRIVEKERGDFYEFFACNIFVALVATAVLLTRSKRLQAMQARQLAARIGLVRPTPGGWSNG